jgi:hypothetical protein
MIVPQQAIDEFIEQWKDASKRELRSRLKSLKKRNQTYITIAEIKAITALLA